MADFAAYVFYVNRPELLLRSVSAFPELREHLTVIDNSESSDAARVLDEVRWLIPPVALTYSQSMRWMLRDAVNRGVDFIIHFHSDAFSTNPDAIQELLTAVRQYKAEGRRWACAWTFYDILWVINPKAMLDIGGWDTEFTDYFTDQDVRRRLDLAGWECIDTHIQGIGHEGSATIRSDPKRQFLNQATFPLRRAYYISKHGGEPGSETHAYPFGNRELSWKL